MTASATLVEPAFCTHPPFERTLGPEVADLCEQAGFGPDPEQRLALDLIFGMDRAGRSVAFESAVVCSRQNLKTGLFKQAVLGWLFLTDQRLIVWSAHEFSTAQEAFRDLSELVEGRDWLMRRVKAIYRGNGEESIELVGGRRLKFRARTKSAGRGLSGDKVVLDEAFALQPAHMGALLPTLSARPDPQVLYGSSAGLADSAVLRAVRDRGRVGAGRLAYVEWCDDLPGMCAAPDCRHQPGAPGCRLDDRARWRRANPAMGRRITEDYIAAERQALSPEEFARERLGWWDDPAGADVLPLHVWAACADPGSVSVGRPVFGLDASPGGRSAAIAAETTRPDGRAHIELVVHQAGTDWVAGRAAELKARHKPLRWVLDPAGPAGALLPALAEKGIKPQQMTGRESGQHCTAFVSRVQSKAIVHVGDPVLAAAVEGATWRDVGDGLTVLSRRRSNADICPLVAAVCADFGLAGRRRSPMVAWR